MDTTTERPARLELRWHAPTATAEPTRYVGRAAAPTPPPTDAPADGMAWTWTTGPSPVDALAAKWTPTALLTLVGAAVWALAVWAVLQ